MPTPTDPAPCSEGENLYECRNCGLRLCSADRIQLCPECDGKMENLSKPRLE